MMLGKKRKICKEKVQKIKIITCSGGGGSSGGGGAEKISEPNRTVTTYMQKTSKETK